MMDQFDGSWRSKLIQPRWPWSSQSVRPADVSDSLTGIMLARENILEDVYYRKVVPNRYVIEVNPENYARNYKTIEGQITQQWRSKLMQELATANSRMGRARRRGPVMRNCNRGELQANQVRIRWQVGQGEIPSGDQAARSCLELGAGSGAGGQRWRLRAGIVTLGRYDVCDIHLDQPDIQERRLISGQHAYLRSEPGGIFRLFDGSPAGKPSRNGTYVNNRRVPPGGYPLQNGDQIVLAAPAPDQPQPGAPGTATLYFYLDCDQGKP
jgi:hypothetical protein